MRLFALEFDGYGTSTDGMPPLQVYPRENGVMVIYDGMTRATRVHEYVGGQVEVEVLGRLPQDFSRLRRIRDQGAE